MANHILLTCTACDQTDDVYCDGDNAMMCPNCGSIDEFKEPEGNEDGA